MQKYKILKAIHNYFSVLQLEKMFFKHAKIQNFESDSQREGYRHHQHQGFLSMQKYKILKAIHNRAARFPTISAFFKHAKIQNFESDSQPGKNSRYLSSSFLSMQKYKILKAIHNNVCEVSIAGAVF